MGRLYQFGPLNLSVPVSTHLRYLVEILAAKEDDIYTQKHTLRNVRRECLLAFVQKISRALMAHKPNDFVSPLKAY
jgi:hypothetical protein